jgi:hypothetical protein
MSLREITHKEVCAALQNPHATGLAVAPFRDRKHSAWNRSAHTAIHVLFEEHYDNIRVVTVYDLRIDKSLDTAAAQSIQSPPVQFRISVETEEITGEVLSAYLQIRKGKRHHAKDFTIGGAIADYDERGFVLGLELFAPCGDTVVDQLAHDESRPIRDGIKRFMKNAGPREFIITS